MTIGDLSARTGVPVKALREYTDLGLIYTLGRSPAGYRLYTDDAEWCVRFIGELRGLGLTIAEICQLTSTDRDDHGRSVGAHLAELLQRSRQRLRPMPSRSSTASTPSKPHTVRIWPPTTCAGPVTRADASYGLDPHPGDRPYRRHRHCPIALEESDPMSTDNLTADVFAKILPAGRDRALMRAALRLLAHGTPVTVTELAAAAGVPDLDPAQTPIGADVEYDEAGRIVGWGLTLNPTPHRFSVGGHQLYTWCAPDTLIFPAVIGAPACIESDCPITGTTVRLTIDPVTGVSDLEPATAMVAFVDPDRIQPGHLRATCCNPQMFLATSDAAHHWQAKFPGMTVLPVTDAYHQLARPLADAITDPTTITGTSACC
ncbi:organomercurial lyase MerB [Rhodococcus sp. F64268]|uniref:organomercurial lyase MerB n=1 Tax=Rhodococcus sp. F64268 TaxID=2926402 RepID=UPI001FF41828|nr:organomercurial lyase MerB [Rhodococcus sp. F64268]MCK0093455.1 organomercurial lyase MerB [Rhodococcus sp. F64268]